MKMKRCESEMKLLISFERRIVVDANYEPQRRSMRVKNIHRE